MAFVGKGSKYDLIELAKELGLEVSKTLKNIEIKELILKHGKYEEEFINMSLSRIIEERKFKVQNAEKESIETEKIREHSLELEKLKLQIEQEKVINQNVNTEVSQSRLAMSHNTKQHNESNS